MAETKKDSDDNSPTTETSLQAQRALRAERTASEAEKTPGLSLKYKLVALLLVLVFGSIIGTLTFMTIDLRAKLRVEAERYATTVAGMVSRLSGVSQTVIGEVESILDIQMMAQAKIAAHMVAAAEKAGESEKEIRKRLKAIVAETQVDEFWITDSKGRAYLTNVDNVDFAFSPDPKKQPQAYIFFELLAGDAKNIAQKARVREIDNSMFKYVGTRGVDIPRIVQVGYDFGFMKDLVDRVGLKRFVDGILKDKRVDSIWIFDSHLTTLAHGSTSGDSITVEKNFITEPDNPETEEAPLAPDQTSVVKKLSIDDKDTLAAVMKSKETKVSFASGHIRVVSPIPATDDGPLLGVTLIRFPTAILRDLLNSSLQNALLLGGVALLIAIIIAGIVGGWLSRPILALTAAARALHGGSLALNHIEPFTTRKDELGVFVREFQRMAIDIHQREEELDRLVKERTAALENAQKQIRDEVALASRFQVAILPTTFPHSTQFTGSGFMRPAKEMGGDFYDIFVIDKNRIGLVIADVSGKGVPAAFFMAVSRTELRNEGMKGGDPAAVLERVNLKLCGENPLNLFVTVFYAVLDHSTGILKYANGGHNPPYIVRAGNKLETIESMGDLVLGMIEDITFQEGQVALKSSDTLFLYTDGISEAFNEKDEEFTNDRMEKVLNKGEFKVPSDVIDGMLSAVDDYVGEAPQSDDITCLCLRYADRR